MPTGDDAIQNDHDDSARVNDGNDNLLRAVAVGLVAGAIGGGLWAAIVLLSNYEVGYAAWGVGLLVGLAMSRTTALRGQTVAAAAGGIAVIGLLVGKVLIFSLSSGSIAREILANPQSMEGAVAWQMYEARELDPATLDSIDAAFAARDTISDRLWATMRQQSTVKIQAMNAGDREAVAKIAARNSLRQMGLMNGVMAQFTGWDLLWFGLAIATAYRMLTQAKVEEAVVESEAPVEPEAPR